MSPIGPHVLRSFCIAIALAAAAGTGRCACAQDDHEPEEDAAAAAAPGVPALAGVAPLAAARIAEIDAQQQALLERRDYERFEQLRDLRKATLDRVLSRRLDAITRSCQLTDAQIKKLKAAGHVDIKRFIDRWEPVARRLASSQRRISERETLMFQWRTLQIEQQRVVVGEDSLFSKTLRRTLEPEQAVRWEQALAAETRPSYATTVSRAVGTLRRNLRLSTPQAENLERLLLKETRPPRRFGNASDMALVMFQLSRLPEETIKPIFDEDQWLRMSHWMEVYKEGAGGEAVLKRHGFIFEDTPARGPAVREFWTKPR
jgi:hypothetical protein